MKKTKCRYHEHATLCSRTAKYSCPLVTGGVCKYDRLFDLCPNDINEVVEAPADRRLRGQALLTFIETRAGYNLGEIRGVLIAVVDKVSEGVLGEHAAEETALRQRAETKAAAYHTQLQQKNDQLEQEFAESMLKGQSEATPAQLIQAYEFGTRHAAAIEPEAKQDVASEYTRVLANVADDDIPRLTNMFEAGSKAEPPTAEPPTAGAGGNAESQQFQLTPLPQSRDQMMALFATETIVTDVCNGVREHAELYGFHSTKNFVDTVCLHDVSVRWGVAERSALHPLLRFMREQSVAAGRRPVEYAHVSAFDLLRFVSNAARHASIECRRHTRLGAMQYVLLKVPVLFSLARRLTLRLHKEGKCTEYGLRKPDAVFVSMLEMLHAQLPEEAKFDALGNDKIEI